jgi:hypothetical protein
MNSVVQCVPLKVDCFVHVLRSMFNTVFTRACHWTPFFQDREDVLSVVHWRSSHHVGRSCTVIRGHCCALGHSCTNAIPGHYATMGCSNGIHWIPLLRSCGSSNGTARLVTKRATVINGPVRCCDHARTWRTLTYPVDKLRSCFSKIRFDIIVLSILKASNWFQASRESYIYISYFSCVCFISYLPYFIHPDNYRRRGKTYSSS